MTVKIKKIETL